VREHQPGGTSSRRRANYGAHHFPEGDLSKEAGAPALSLRPKEGLKGQESQEGEEIRPAAINPTELLERREERSPAESTSVMRLGVPINT
jgi:hypothetical protein